MSAISDYFQAIKEAIEPDAGDATQEDVYIDALGRLDAAACDLGLLVLSYPTRRCLVLVRAPAGTEGVNVEITYPAES